MTGCSLVMQAISTAVSFKHTSAVSLIKDLTMQRHIFQSIARTLTGLLFLSMTVPLVHGQQKPITDASKSAYDFDRLSGVIDADQVDYFSGNWSYAVPLGDVEGAGGMSLPIRMRYSSAVTGTDRLIKLSDDPAATSTQSKGTVTLNNATWVGLGWNLEFGAIRVTGGYNLRDVSSPINHPFSFNLSLVLPDGSHRLVRQLDDSQRAATPGVALPATNVYYAENRRFMDIRWNFDRNAPLSSTWTVKTVSGLVYTFGAVTISGRDYGMNQTVKGGAAAQGGFNELMPEMVYQWNLAEIRDQAGNTIRFRYTSDGPVTTVRDWAKERAEATRSFRNLLTFGDLDPRYPGGITVGQSRTNLTVVKTFNTAHLDTVILAGADGKVVRKVTTETSARPDIHIATYTPRNSDPPVIITYDNYFDTHIGDTLSYGHYLVTDNRNYRMYDGLSSTHRLDALTVTDGSGSQVARYAFRYDGANGGPPRPAVASGDNARTLLLEEIAVKGTGNSAGDQLPPHRFTNTLADSYRITKIVTPTGGELKLVYEQVPRPVATWAKHINYDESFFDRSRRIKRRIRDADGLGGAAADTTTFVYVQTDAVMETVDSRRVRRITFPIVDEILPGSHGRIRRNFAGEADLDALGLSARNKQHESERDIRRGLLKEVTWHDGIGAVVQRERKDWQVTTQGTWTGESQSFYHPGIPQQAYWLRAGETTTTRDGVSTTTLTNHNARNGLVATQTLKSGSRTLRVTETSYHADAVTSSPVTLAFGQPVLDSSISTGDRVHAAFLSPGDPPTASVEAFLNAGSSIESTGVYDFEGRRFSVSGTDALRIRGVLGTDQLQGTGNMYAGATVTVDWKDGGSRVAGSLTRQVPAARRLPRPKEESFDVLVPVPSNTDSAHVTLELHAGVYKLQQAVYRKIRVYARDLEVTAMSADDPEDVFLENVHILDRPHVVTVKDGSGTRLQSTRHRYGRFNGGSIVMPDTTSAWLDRDSDGQVDTGEWIDRQVATGYDAYGNLTGAQDAHGTVTTTVMGYGRMRPVAAFTGASGAQVAAEVFDDQGSWTDLTSPGGGAWSKTGAGTPAMEDGALIIDNAAAKRNIPANTAGVFEIDVMAGAENERTAVALASGGNDRIRWVFGADGAFRVLSGATLTATGASCVANRWYRVKIQWDGSKWWAHVDGARYPASGTYAMAAGGKVNQVKLSNGAAPKGAAFDNLRVWPRGAQPGLMTTWDPVTLDAVAVTDPNGHTTRFLRDGLRRVVQTSDTRGRITAQRDHRFSRGIGGFSAYNSARPNRQTVIAYPSRDGHKDLSRDGHRIVARGTALKEGNALEEGVSLETAGAYVVAAGDDVAIKAGVRIKLTRGFRAEKGAAFRAGVDPLAGGDEVTGSGDVTWNQQKAAKRSVKLGPSSVLETGRVDGHVTARADFHPASASSGKTVIMSFDDGDDHVRVVYENGSVSLESSIDGRTSTNAFVPGYNASWPWARVEMELLPTGTVNAWLYGHRDTRFKGASATASVPANWRPAFKANGERGNGYLANLYVGATEMVASSFDGLARQIQTRASGGANDIVTQTNYNRAGKPETLLGPAHQAASHTYGALARADAAERITQVSYDDDPLLRVSRVIPPGHTQDNAVDSRYGNWGAESGQGRSYQTVDDEKGVLSTSVYDAYGRMRHAIADSAGTDAATRNNRTSFVYDALDRLVSTTMPGGGTSRYAYDTLGRMTSRHHPDADGPVRYKYDDSGRIRFSQDARQRAAGTGKVTYTVYDAFGRVTRVGEAAAAFSSLDPESDYPFERDSVSWRSRMTYDGGDAAGGGPNYAQGRLVKVGENTDSGAAAEVVHEYAYDHLGNVRVKQVEIDGLTGEKTVEYVHDLAGRVTRLIYPDGAQAGYAYDSAGRLSRVWDAHGRTLAAYTHTAAGNIDTHVVGHTVGDGAGDGAITGRYTYNAREWETDLNYAGTFKSTLTYDPAGNVTRQVYRHGSAASKTAEYEYDDLHRLTGFDLDGGASTRSYRYDRNGNMTRMTKNRAGVRYYYNPRSRPNRMDWGLGATGNSVKRFVYNENGWMTRAGTDTVTYDYRGLTTGYGSATYLMDPDRRRVKKNVGTAVTYYLRGADGAVLAEYSGQTLSARYVYAGTRRIARIAGDSASYYLADHLGSTRSLVDEEGAVTAAYDYWPYGKVLATSGAESTHFRFTGHERDPESGLDYMLARSYDYDIGRFLRPDPMQDEYPGISPYAYANNNPLKFVDPDGRTPAFVVGAIAGAGLDIATQVLVDGRSLEEIDLGSVALSAGTGALGVGVLTKLSHLSSIALYGSEAAIGGAASISHQLYETGEIDPIDTTIDALAGIGGGRGSQLTRNKIEASDRVQDLRGQANQKLRIARNTSSVKGARRRTEQARRLNQRADNTVTRYAVSVSAAVSQVGSSLLNWWLSDEEE